VATHSITTAANVYDSNPMYVGYDGDTDYFVGYMDEIEYWAQATAVFGTQLAYIYTSSMPYVEIDVPVSSLDLGDVNNINNVKLLNVELEKSSSSTGSLGLSLGTYAADKFISGHEGVAQLTHQAFSTFNSPQCVEEFNRNVTRFTQVMDPAFANEYFTLRIYFFSDGRQPISLTGISVSSIDAGQPISAGSDKTVIFGESIRPFSDGGIHMGASYPGLFSVTRNGAAYEYPAFAGMRTGEAWSGATIDVASVEFQRLRLLSVTANNYLISPDSAADLMGQGQNYSEVELGIESGTSNDSMTLIVRPYYVTVYTRDCVGDVILSTLGDTAPTLTIYDAWDNVIEQDYTLTGTDYFSLFGGTYTFKVEQADYVDQEFEIIVDADRDVEMLIAPPKLRGTRLSDDAVVYVESIRISHDIHTIVQ